MSETSNQPAASLQPEFDVAHLFAHLDGGVISEITASKWDLRVHTSPLMQWMDISEISPSPAVGWSFNPSTHVFSAPPAPVAQPKTKFTPLEFMGRFTQEEDAKIATAAQSNAQVLFWMLSMTAANYIDLLDARTIAGVNALTTFKLPNDPSTLITTDRATVILTPTL